MISDQRGEYTIDVQVDSQRPERSAPLFPGGQRRPLAVLLPLLLAGCLSTAATAFAQDETESDLAARLAELESTIKAQQEDMETQRKAMERTIQRQQEQLDAQFQLIQQLQAQQASPSDAVAPVAAAPATPVADPAREGEPGPGSDEGTDSSEVVASSTRPTGQEAAEQELQTRVAAGEETGEVNARATLYDPSNTVFDPDFPGAWHLPGRSSAMRIGGYVNLGLVTSFDSLLITDRFIVGSIPPEGQSTPGAQSGTDVTVRQSRLNFEVREQTTHGTLRAFIEGDFEGDGSSFRLRHAFGQYRALLAGQTWSTFANPNSLPEEVDFEGVNGVVLLRQPQLRFAPEFGKDASFVFSIEEPGTEVVNGTGSKGQWDVIASVDRLSLGDIGGWNYRVSAILRDLEGQVSAESDTDPGSDVESSSTTGWGITTSGQTNIGEKERESFLLWQVTYGKGIGRYINDLATIGGGDAVFDENGDLRALPVLAGFVSYRDQWATKPWFMKDWPGILRSNVTLSWIGIDNYEFQDDLDYNQTLRLSANMMYFPTQNLRFGTELLWGQRKNNDNSKGTATQIQISARYNF